MPTSNRLYQRIYGAVEQVPPGMVATYGDIATLVAEEGCDARTVGEALRELPPARLKSVPWQRIVNSTGGLSLRGPQQRLLLEAEGVTFDQRGRIDLDRFRWRGPDSPPQPQGNEQLRLL